MRIRSLALPGLAAIVVAVLALVLAPHSSAPASASAQASVKTTARRVAVVISNFAYMPASLTVKAGTTVTWTNRDQTAHTATGNSGGFDTGTINPGKSQTIDFKKPGTYTYHCSFHAFMVATITVVK